LVKQTGENIIISAAQTTYSQMLTLIRCDERFFYVTKQFSCGLFGRSDPDVTCCSILYPSYISSDRISPGAKLALIDTELINGTGERFAIS
jgi:hypothetical protein